MMCEDGRQVLPGLSQDSVSAGFIRIDTEEEEPVVSTVQQLKQICAEGIGTDGAISEIKDFEAQPIGNVDEADFHSGNRRPMQSHFKFVDSSGGQ